MLNCHIGVIAVARAFYEIVFFYCTCAAYPRPHKCTFGSLLGFELVTQRFYIGVITNELHPISTFICSLQYTERKSLRCEI